jgi:uncharacterized membrane protein
MDDYLRNYVIALPLFIVLDFAWIGFVMKRVYLQELGNLARTFDGVFKPNLPASLLAWALIPAGVVIFAVPRLTSDSGVPEVIGWGALFGAITYGIYDLTNLATLKDYSLKLTALDIAWGAALSAAITLVVWLVAK